MVESSHAITSSGPSVLNSRELSQTFQQNEPVAQRITQRYGTRLTADVTVLGVNRLEYWTNGPWPNKRRYLQSSNPSSRTHHPTGLSYRPPEQPNKSATTSSTRKTVPPVQLLHTNAPIGMSVNGVQVLGIGTRFPPQSFHRWNEPGKAVSRLS